MPIVYRIFQNKEKLLESAAFHLNKTLLEAKNKNQNVLLLLSGGSALILLDKIESINLSSKITIGVLDERYSRDKKVNNMSQIMAADFYKKAKEKGCLFIDTRVKKDESMDKLAKRFDESLKDWFNNHRQSLVIAAIGIGADGHIAGIMPYPEDMAKFNNMFEQEQNWVVAYNAGNKNPYPQRVTAAMVFLRKINAATVYVVGENKIQALRKLKTEGSLAEVPSRILNELRGKIFLFTDQKV